MILSRRRLEVTGSRHEDEVTRDETATPRLRPPEALPTKPLPWALVVAEIRHPCRCRVQKVQKHWPALAMFMMPKKSPSQVLTKPRRNGECGSLTTHWTLNFPGSPRTLPDARLSRKFVSLKKQSSQVKVNHDRTFCQWQHLRHQPRLVH